MKYTSLFCISALMGLKSIIIFYLYDFLLPFSDILFLVFLVVFGLLNGFIDVVIISRENTAMKKIFSWIMSLIFTISLLFLSLRLHLPDILACYSGYKYRESDICMSLDAGNWFGFFICLKIYFCTSLLSFIIIMTIIWNVKKKNKRGITPEEIYIIGK